MTGWLVPPVTGEIYFHVANDYLSEVWLSADDDPANSTLILNHRGHIGSYLYEHNDQKSKPMALVADHAYYFEVRDEHTMMSFIVIASSWPKCSSS